MEITNHTEIFNSIKKRLVPYGKKMEVRTNTPSDYHLYIVKDIELAGRKYGGCYFSGVKINSSGMVSFYFFPYYTHPQQFTIPQVIQKNLKGKNCFNFKKLQEAQEASIAQLLQQGFTLYSSAFGLA